MHHLLSTRYTAISTYRTSYGQWASALEKAVRGDTHDYDPLMDSIYMRDDDKEWPEFYIKNSAQAYIEKGESPLTIVFAGHVLPPHKEVEFEKPTPPEGEEWNKREQREQNEKAFVDALAPQAKAIAANMDSLKGIWAVSFVSNDTFYVDEEGLEALFHNMDEACYFGEEVDDDDDDVFA